MRQLSRWIWPLLLALVTRESLSQVDSIAQLKGIQSRISKGYPFKPSEQRFVLDREAYGGHMERLTAHLILTSAADRGVFSRSRLLSLIEKRMKEDEGVRALTHTNSLQHALHISVSRSDALYVRLQPILLKGSSLEAFTKEERILIRECFANKLEKNRRIAAGLLVSKRGLSRAWRNWCLDLVGERIRATQGNSKLFWQAVARVVRAKT